MSFPKLVFPLALVALAAAGAVADDDPAAPPENGANGHGANGAGTEAGTKPAADLEWMPDFDKAVERAKAEKKDLLVDFTGSDWCTWCIKLHDEVFADEAFRPVAKDYVLVALDFPRNHKSIAKVPNPKRNEELRAKHGVEGFPTVLLMTADGDVFGQTGYQPGGGAAYVKHLGELRTKGRGALDEAIALAKEFDAADEAARGPVAEKVLTKVEGAGPGDFWAAKLLPALNAIRSSDPQNEKGLRARAVAGLLKAGPYDATVVDDARKLDPENEQGLFENAVKATLEHAARKRNEDAVREYVRVAKEYAQKGKWKDRETAEVLLVNAAFWAHKAIKDPEAAKLFATKLRDVVDPSHEQIKELVEEILSGEKADEDGDAGGE